MRVPWEIFRAYDIRGRAEGADAPLTAGLAEADWACVRGDAVG